jgi:ABA DEFICIENT 4-like
LLAKVQRHGYIDIVNIQICCRSIRRRRPDKERPMDWNSLFSLMNSLAMAGWLVLLLAPRRFALLAALPRMVVPGVIAIVYTALMGAHFATIEGGFGSIAAVRALFASDPVLVAGWGHYLGFDLLIGVLLAERMDRAGVTRLLQAPVLLTTFMFGPAGWLLGTVTEAAARFRSQHVARA